MYCKNCGKQLSSDARFCDRCGKPVKSDSTRKPSSNSSSKPKQDYERRQKKETAARRKKKKNNQTAVFLVLLSIAAAMILGFASYNATKKGLDKDDAVPSPTPQATDNTTEQESASPLPSKEPVTEQPDNDDEPELSKADFSSIAEKCNIYRDERMKNIRCPYPNNFEQSSKANSSTIISLMDPINDGSMMICAQAVGSNTKGSVLMKEYADGLGASITSSRAGDDWYTLTFERNNKISHRMAVISDGTCVYYDFSYDIDSGEKSSYDEYISYFDFYLSDAIKDLSEDKSKNED